MFVCFFAVLNLDFVVFKGAKRPLVGVARKRNLGSKKSEIIHFLSHVTMFVFRVFYSKNALKIREKSAIFRDL